MEGTVMWIVKDGNQTKQKKVYDIYFKNSKEDWIDFRVDQGFKLFVIHWVFSIRFLKISLFQINLSEG